MATEKQFELKVRRFLEGRGCWVLKTWGGGMQRSGIPDLLVCCDGLFLGIELKAERGKPTPLQLWNIDKIKDAGGIGMVLYPNGYESFKKLIMEILDDNTKKEN
ncbi:holliday junction resolvase (hjc) [Eubacterium aggregans]|uniref:Holliday junction resolvase (Hjc) n=1 Tax=Eubacterium aggregans TaxID=81409 RepID=A0A1H3Y2H5_9FIRM|nr:VRR-NUC domain-containing protein [Eubacterium aggregans]SEA05261.1 holliday junction resolvase (hjc) [Eubacterium aggregans]